MKLPDADNIPGLVLQDEGPVFDEPWQAQAFALAVGMHEQGLFSWSEWADELGKAIAGNDADVPYYELWLCTLETMVQKKALLRETEIQTRQADWQSALLATPHGMPIELNNGRG